MKKFILISFCLCVILGVILLNRGRNVNVDIVSKYFVNGNKTFYYPLFNRENIDNYIWEYLNSNMNYGEKLFLDYDYRDNEEGVTITFYFYGENDMGVRYKRESLYVDMGNELVKRVDTQDNSTTSYRALNKKESKYIAFTFDDGPNYNSSKMVDVLSKWGMRATFFVVGNRAIKEEDILLKMTAKGMEIGNHTYSHKLLTKLSSDVIREEITRTDRVIFDITGRNVSLVRPSYGSSNKRVRMCIDRPIIVWDIDTLDWKYHNSKRLSDYILDNVRDGDIVLMHDIYSATVNGVDMVIPKLMDRGYRIVSVSELFSIRGMELESGKVYGRAY